MSADPHPGALPAYLRIAERLTIEIGAGRLAAGDRLPPERRMAAQNGVSMMTLRKALAVVAERGLIERRQGSGNYVRGGARNVGTYALFRLEAVPGGGGLPTARLLSLDEGPSPEALSDMPGRAWRIRRLRALDGVPVAVEEIWLHARYGTLKASHLSESLYRFYRERLSLDILRAEDRVSVGPLPDWAPTELGPLPGDTMGLVERLAFDQYGKPAEASRTWFDPARARYHARVP
ncbi:GntR family transcriptional regulator [Roseibacterium sp. SDUM158016]|uniref:GntR family transcriptional regulator n=1 Tax=Roseicyclus sediminis TaxID=2980997 RepID=UPI0021D147F6|nr:GntR family transcriptional regulator [Roseibacterium sp. SDUM158016]MCU4653584.1 GntR family transcriptional regulator [Roseibacterium sp. SDUM158016]